MSTPDLAISHISASQNQKEVTANAAFDALDLALTSAASVAVADAPLTLPVATAYGNMCFTFTGATTADRLITLPSTKKLYIVWNQTTGGNTLTFGTALAGRTATINPLASPAAYNVLYCDGTNVDVISASSLTNSSLSSEAVVNLVANNTVLSSVALNNLVLEFTGTLTAAGSVQLPAVPKLYIVWNETTGNFPLSFYTASSPVGRVAVIPNSSSPITFWWLYCDGTNVDIINPPPPSEALEYLISNNSSIVASGDIENNLVFKFTGTLTAPGSVQLPPEPREYIVWNQTTGGFSLTFYLANSPVGRVAVVNSASPATFSILYCDGTNVDIVSQPVGGQFNRSGNTVARVNDNDSVLTFNSSLPVTYTLQSPVFSSTWTVWIKNIGTGAVTVNRNGLLIDGKAQNVILYQGDCVMITADGTNYETGNARPLSIGIFVPGTMTNSQVLLYLQMDRPCIFPASAPNSLATAKTSATASTTITLKKNGGSFATVVFAAGGATGAWTQAADASFSAGDTLEIDAPASADATLANVGITLQGYRF